MAFFKEIILSYSRLVVATFLMSESIFNLISVHEDSKDKTAAARANAYAL